MNGAAVEVRGLRKTYTRHLLGGRRAEVLRGVDLRLEPGSCTVIRGSSGSGKSTLLRCLYGNALADGGSIAVDAGPLHLDVTGADERTILRARRDVMALATQFLSVVPRVGAIDLVAAAGAEKQEAADLLSSLGLPSDLHEVAPATFSGGQRQLLNLALALARPRPLLLLDEVTASLDPARRERVLAVLESRKRSGVTLLAVFHDLPNAAGLVDRVLTMSEGRVAA